MSCTGPHNGSKECADCTPNIKTHSVSRPNPISHAACNSKSSFGPQCKPTCVQTRIRGDVRPQQNSMQSTCPTNWRGRSLRRFKLLLRSAHAPSNSSPTSATSRSEPQDHMDSEAFPIKCELHPSRSRKRHNSWLSVFGDVDAVAAI